MTTHYNSGLPIIHWSWLRPSRGSVQLVTGLGGQARPSLDGRKHYLCSHPQRRAELVTASQTHDLPGDGVLRPRPDGLTKPAPLNEMEPCEVGESNEIHKQLMQTGISHWKARREAELPRQTPAWDQALQPSTSPASSNSSPFHVF